MWLLEISFLQFVLYGGYEMFYKDVNGYVKMEIMGLPQYGYIQGKMGDITDRLKKEGKLDWEEGRHDPIPAAVMISTGSSQYAKILFNAGWANYDIPSAYLADAEYLSLCEQTWGFIRKYINQLFETLRMMKLLLGTSLDHLLSDEQLGVLKGLTLLA
ncbi:MAG: hypothetical protein PHW01_00045 [Patescibacteria group bacterium]|nr:hypothetical protein [Patescibacteria group bacterium]